MKKLLFVIAAIAIIFTACDDDDKTHSYEEQLAIDIEKIQEYLTENNLTAQSTESGLHYIIEEEGTGNYPTVDSIVKVTYTGKFLSGEIFDAGTVDYYLGGFIYGWQEGIALFKEGGSGKLLIPSGLGYGNVNYYDIPKNSVLLFDIELLEVTGIEEEEKIKKEV